MRGAFHHLLIFGCLLVGTGLAAVVALSSGRNLVAPVESSPASPPLPDAPPENAGALERVRLPDSRHEFRREQDYVDAPPPPPPTLLESSDWPRINDTAEVRLTGDVGGDALSEQWPAPRPVAPRGLVAGQVDTLRAPATPSSVAPPAVAPATPLPETSLAVEPPAGGTVIPESLPPQTANAQRDEGKAELFRSEGDGRLTLNIQNSDIRKVLEIISEGGNLNILASKNVSGTVSASLTNVDLHAALDAILKSTGYVARREQNFIFVGTVEDMKAMRLSGDAMGMRVYRPSYIKAADFELLLTPLLSEEGKVTVSKAAQTDIPVDKTKTGGDSFAHAEVVIVRDYEQHLQQIDQVVAELDCPPQQVAIEAVILSVRLNNTHRLGVDFEALRNKNNARLISGSPLADLAQIDVTSGGLHFGFLDASLAVFVEALETVGETDVVASPRLMCLNKQRAEILIGSEFGYVSTTTVTENAATQAIDFLKVGTHLIFRPFIGNDGMVRLEVHPELSTGNVRVVQGLTLPDKETTEVTTNIMCPDGRSVIIGGLIREDQTNNASQIPLLGSLPYVGALFRRRGETLDRREIIVVLTPHIVREPDAYLEADQANREFEERSAVFANKMSPTSKRRISERHLRKSRAAWNAGDARTAFREANLAVHFEPLNLEAVTLRSQIVEAFPEFDQNLNTRLNAGLAPPTYPLRNYTRQGAPWKSERGLPETGPLIPPDVYRVHD